MKYLFLTALFFVVHGAVHAALPPAGDIPKEGDCPSDYSAKGTQCVPGANARFAFVKYQHCPDSYVEQGNYCIATPESRLAIRKAAMSCPAGFEPVGNYCISEK